MLCGCFSFALRLAVANRINDRGVRIDTELVQEAITCDLMLSDAMSKKAYELTGLENPNSVSQLKTWLEERGIPMDTLGKKDVAQMITELDKNGVDAEALDMLKLRLQMAKSSVKKYQAAERCVCSDGRARGLFQFYGASRTGRYSGRNIQLQNLPQNHISTLDEARTLVKMGCFDMVESIYGNTPDVLSQLTRTMLIPKDGCEFIVADFSAIEARVLAWEAEEQWVLDAFQNGEDLYCATASQMFHVPVVKHGVNGDLRQKGKIATLACGYGGSSGALISMGALQMGLHEEELPEIIDSWREANPKIVQYWWDTEKAAMTAYKTGERQEVGKIAFEFYSGTLWMVLPSGRRLAYLKPRQQPNRFGRMSLTYEGVGQNHKWSRQETYSGRLVENATQAIARDILAEAMDRISAEGLNIVAHVHDEVIIEAPKDKYTVDEVCKLMSVNPVWCKGLPLAAAGYKGDYQTWTYSPELDWNGKLRGTDQIPGFLRKKYAFDRYGDYHFVPYGHHNGQSHGFSYCYFRKGGQFRLVASLDETPGYTILRYDSRKALLTLERDCAGVEHPGGSFPLFDLFFAAGSETEVFDGWFQAMGIRPRTEKKLAGYSSWYNRYQDITEDTIREDLTGCRSLLCPGDLFQIDDGWEPKVGDWLETDAQKFPHGLKGMVEEIHASGFQAGLWLAPFVCEKDSALFRQHPDWLLKMDGAPWCCGSNWSSFYALDIDNPAVLDYLHRVFDRVLNDWGFDLVKLDFLYGAAPFGNARESRAARMYRAMELLRSLCGQKTILGCGVPVMPAFGLVDYCRVSCDVSLDWNDVWYMRLFHRERVSTKQAINNTVFRRQLNGRAYGSDPDVFFLREENCKLTAEQKRTLATLNALLGNVFLTSDMPSHYTEARRAEYRRLRDIFEHAKQVEVETENDMITIRYSLDGERQELRRSVL